MAEFGRQPMPASYGHLFSMASPSPQLGLWRWPLPTPRQFMSEPASLTFAPLFPSAMVSTSPWMAAEPGTILVWKRRDISAELSSILRMRPPSTSEHWDMFTNRTSSVVFTSLPTVARTGPRFSIKDPRSASLIWLSVLLIHDFCSPGRGTHG